MIVLLKLSNQLEMLVPVLVLKLVLVVVLALVVV
jgi:hypothetical protein